MACSFLSSPVFSTGDFEKVNLTIVETEEQDIALAPNKSFFQFFKYMLDCTLRVDGFVAATLSSIQKSEQLHV